MRRSGAFQVKKEGVHDGHVAGNCIYFTAVNGLVLRVDLASGEMQTFDLNLAKSPYKDRPLGWCRGIFPYGERAWVGILRIRYTALRKISIGLGAAFATRSPSAGADPHRLL